MIHLTRVLITNGHHAGHLGVTNGDTGKTGLVSVAVQERHLWGDMTTTAVELRTHARSCVFLEEGDFCTI